MLVTGAAGFIGFHVVQRLLADGITVVGVDNLSDYYDVALKQARLEILQNQSSFTFQLVDIANREALSHLFESQQFDVVVNLAAQAGVRYSIENPAAYVDANIVGFANVLEACRQTEVQHLIYASSSSVYGANTSLPFSVKQHTDHPVSLYGATKKSNELMAHAYSHLYGLPTTGLRFFTVYGPWGRPDMALSLFAHAITDGKPIQLFNEGKMQRSFTFVDDVVEPLRRLIDRIPQADEHWNGDAPNPSTSNAPFQIFNVGSAETVELARFVKAIEACLGKTAVTELLPLQPGDVPATCADVTQLENVVGFTPQTTIDEGIAEFCQWFGKYYGK